MNSRRRHIAAALIALVTAISYGIGLERRPIGPDEARVVSAAQRLPQSPGVLIDAGDRWLQPFHVYGTALAHIVDPGFLAGRWVSVAMAALGSALLFLAGWRLLGGYAAATAAAVTLVMTPAHVTYGRLGVEAISIVPFVALWLVGVAGFLTTDRPSSIALASAALGAGVYTTTAAPLTMAFLFLAMIVVLWNAGRRKLSTILVAAASFVAMLLPLAIWFALKPGTYLDTYGGWAIHPAHIRSPYDLLLASVNRNTLGARASAYWGFIDPSFLFFSSGEGSAVLHWAMAPLIALGMYRCVAKRSPAHLLILVAAIAAPMGGAAFGQPHYVANALAVLPPFALLAACGIDLIRELIAGPPPASADEES